MNVSRFEASVVLDILSLEAVASAFFIDISELGILSQWVEDNGVVWGWDLESRVNEDLPPYDSASWVRGLSRMVCGYAMGGALASVGTDTSLYFDSSTEGNGASSGTGLVVPYTEIDGDFSDLLGRFMNFLVSLKKLSSNLERARTLEDWQSFISVDVLTGFFVASNDDDEADLLYIQSSLEDLSQTDVGLVPAEVILDYFNESIGSSGNSSGFYRGKVTFCSLLPMRSIPAKIVCLLGMNLGEFPRQDRPSGFDLMARDFQPCDRSRRHDDRYLFLEAILAARERLYISYIGRSRDDNSLIAPSVLVDELKETVNNNFILPPLRPSLFDGHSLLFCEHEERLQPFSLDYFNGTSEDKFSYSVANFEGAAAIVARVHQRPFFSLPDDSQFVLPLTFIESTNKVNTREIHTSFDELLSFYKNPLLYLLKTGLDIAPLDLSSPETESNDEFPEDGLLQWKIRKIVFDHFVSNSSSSVEGRGVLSPEELKNQIHRYLFCSGRLSESHCHNLLFEKNYGKASTFASSPMPSSLDSVSVASLCSIGSPNYISLSIKIADITVHLSGICGLVAGNNLLSLRFGKRKFIDVIKTIIFHLAAQIEGLASEGTFFVYEKEPKGNPGEVTVDVFRKIDSDIARKHLLVILDWYCKGLQKPLPFIPYDDLFKKALTSLKKGEPFEKGLVSFTEPTNESIALCLGTTALGTCDELYGITLWFASLYLDLKEGV
jgi:exonuclease V gamma subunit